MRKTHMKIYRSRLHLASTLLVVALPFVFLAFFSRWAHIASGWLFDAIAISFIRLMFSYCIAAILGWSLAVLFYHGRRAAIALPVFDVLQSFPTFAILPLTVYLWGPSNYTVVFFLVVTIIWPILFSVISALKLLKAEWVEAAAIYRLNGVAYFRYFLLPVTVPALITGSIVGLGEGWEALIATEIIVGMQNGLGSFFQSFSHNAAVTGFCVLGFLLIIFSINKLLWLPLLERSHAFIEE